MRLFKVLLNYEVLGTVTASSYDKALLKASKLYGLEIDLEELL